MIEIKKFKFGQRWITWGLFATVIMVILQTSSVEAEKEKTLDVIPVGASDEYYERNYVPPPPPPRQEPPRPRPAPPPPPPARAPLSRVPPPVPPRRTGIHNDYSEEYTRSRNRQISNIRGGDDDVLPVEKEEGVPQDVGRPKPKPKTTPAPHKPKPDINVAQEFAPGGDQNYNPYRRRQDRLDELNNKGFAETVKETPNNVAPKHDVQPAKIPHKVKDAVPLREGGRSDGDDLGSPETIYGVGLRRY